MGFNLEAFRASSIAPREKDIPVPELAAFFAEGIEPVWRIRGLTGEQVARARESGVRYKAIAVAVQALTSQSAQKAEKVEAMEAMIGYGTDVPEDLAQRFDHLEFGSVEPKIDHADAVRLFAGHAFVAYKLTNEILMLTGAGPDPGKV